jgi:GNAT superfamily N-acetyltransferase
MTSTATTTAKWQVVQVPLHDPRVRPLLDELAAEYTNRYGNQSGSVEAELNRYPATEFEPPNGAVLLVLVDGVSVAGGAFRRWDARTAEFKRIWTASTHRRQGLARLVLDRLEAEAKRRGYAAVHLTTGPRQPEARALYLACGYQPQFDLVADPEDLGQLAFDKVLPASAGQPSNS